MNTALLHQIADTIGKYPEAFDMNTWDCGTTACIAGWALRLRHVEVPKNAWEWIRTAECLLALSDETSAHLFYVTLWPIRFADDYRAAYMAHNNARCAEIAAARIHHFIKTDGRE